MYYVNEHINGPEISLIKHLLINIPTDKKNQCLNRFKDLTCRHFIPLFYSFVYAFKYHKCAKDMRATKELLVRNDLRK